MDLNSLTDWATKWQMSFNTSKCSILRITTKTNPLIHNYNMQNDYLDSVKHHPYLGVELSHNLKWTEHISNITLKANKALWFIRRNLWRCPTSIKQQMYFALVRPILEYACVVWDPHTSSDIQRVEMVQRRAARFVSNNYKKSEGTVTNLLDKLNWKSLEERRKNARLTTMYKIITRTLRFHYQTTFKDQKRHKPVNIMLQNFVSWLHIQTFISSASFRVQH